MKKVIQQLAVGVFAAWLVLLSATVSPQLSAHASQHAQHSAATHATPLCSWLCAAGLSAEGSTPPALFVISCDSPAFRQEYSARDLHPVSFHASRGPPSLTVSR